jgi:hypothetical protein
MSTAEQALRRAMRPHARTCPHCGGDLEAGGGKPRSVEQHRRYFALMRAVFHHWPETHAVQFTSQEELRVWLQMKAGHRQIGVRTPLGEDRNRDLFVAEAAIRGCGSNAMPVIFADELVVWKPKSIAFGKLGHEAFCKLNDEIDAVIKAETGLDADQLLKEHEAAA